MSNNNRVSDKIYASYTKEYQDMIELMKKNISALPNKKELEIEIKSIDKSKSVNNDVSVLAEDIKQLQVKLNDLLMLSSKYKSGKFEEKKKRIVPIF